MSLSIADGSMSGRGREGPQLQHQLGACTPGDRGHGRSRRDRPHPRLHRHPHLHRVNTPDEIVRLAGTHQIPKLTTRIAEDGVTRDRSIHRERELKIDPDHARQLAQGHAYIITEGRMTKAQILRAPALSAPLPTPGTRATPDAPRKLETTTTGASDELPF